MEIAEKEEKKKHKRKQRKKSNSHNQRREKEKSEREVSRYLNRGSEAEKKGRQGEENETEVG